MKPIATHSRYVSPLLFAFLALNSAQANNIAIGSPTTTFWPGGAPYIFFDDASTGGTDTTPAASISFDRDFTKDLYPAVTTTPLNVGPGGSQISINGIGWASAGASAFGATNATVTITYLGLDGVFGGTDDVVVGTATDAVNASANAGTWVWVFSTQMVKVIDGLNSQFRITITKNTGNNISFKTQSGTTPALAKLSVSGSSTAFAAAPISTWTGATSNSWAVAGNWNPAAIPGLNDVVKFDASSTLNLSTVLSQNFSIAGLTIADPPAPVSIGVVSTLTLGSKGIDMSTATQNLTITAPLELGAANAWNVASGRTLTVNGGVSGAFGIITTGPGTVLLGGINSYTGVTTVAAGVLLNGSATAIPATNTLTVSGTGTFDLNGNNLTLLRINGGSSTGTITNSGAAAVITETDVQGPISSLVTGNLSFRIGDNNIGNPPFALANANTFTGGVTLINSLTANGTRLYLGAPIVTVGSPGAIVSSPFGTGSIKIGESTEDRAGILFQTANNTLVNDVVFNTVKGFGNGSVNPGIRVDNIGIVLSGQITANLADATFTNAAANGGIGGAVTLTGKITGAMGLALTPSSAVTNYNLAVTLNNAAANNDYVGNTTLTNAGGSNYKLVLGAADQIPNGVGKGDVVDGGTLDLNTFSETINGLSGDGVVDTIAGGTPVLTVGDANASSTFGGIIQNTAGTLALKKIGSGILALSAANTYSGNTTITGGTVSFGSVNPNNETSTVSISSGALFGIEFAGTDTVDKLFINGVQQPAGNYTAASPSFTGAGGGTLTVTSSAGGGGGYTAFTAVNAPTGTPQDDFDNDGVSNGVEYVVGGTKNTSDAAKLAQSSLSGGNFVFTFKRVQTSIDGTTAVVIEVGTNLTTWPDTYPVPSGAVANSPGVTVVKDSPTAGIDTVTLTLPQAPDSKKFARLRVKP